MRFMIISPLLPFSMYCSSKELRDWPRCPAKASASASLISTIRLLQQLPQSTQLMRGVMASFSRVTSASTCSSFRSFTKSRNRSFSCWCASENRAMVSRSVSKYGLAVLIGQNYCLGCCKPEKCRFFTNLST